MVSTNRKALARDYMREHGVKYTEALRATGYSPPDQEPPVQHILLRFLREHSGSGGPHVDDQTFETMAAAKAAGGEAGDVIVVGFFAPDDADGGPPLWHSHPHGSGSSCNTDMWEECVYWDDSPRVPYGWSPAWFQRFPYPRDATSSPGLSNGDATNGLEGLMFRFVTTSGSLVTRVLPELSIRTTLARYTGQHDLLDSEMERITAGLDPRLGIHLKSASTVHGSVSYWEFETPDLARFVSWTSLDRHEEERLGALSAWTVFSGLQHESSINQLPFTAPETCEFCEDPITRHHPLAPGGMIGLHGEFESVVDIETPFDMKSALGWDDVLLTHIYGGTQLVSHDGCAEYWSE